nr:DJ-1/PfpI family protein [Bradyrhizobium altum]
MDLSGRKIAILATHGFEQSGLEVPRDRLKKAGAIVEIVSIAAGEIKGWDKKDWGRPVKVDKTLDQAVAADYDAIVLPGGHHAGNRVGGCRRPFAYFRLVFRSCAITR